MNDKDTLKKLIGLFKPHKKNLCFIFLLLIFSTLISSILPMFNKIIIDEGFMKSDVRIIISTAIYIFLLSMFSSFLDLLKEKRRIKIASNIIYSLHKAAFNRLMKVKVKYFTDKNCSEILNRVSTDISNISQITDGSMLFIVSQCFSLVGGVIGLFIISWELTLIVLFLIPIEYLILKSFAKKRKSLAEKYITKDGEYSHWFEDSLNGVKETRLFNLFIFKEKEFADKQNQVITSHMGISLLDNWRITVERFLIGGLVLLIYASGSTMILDSKLSVGSIFAFITYSAYVTTPISSMLNIGYLLSGIMPSARRYYSLLEEEIEACDVESANYDVKLLNPFGSIQFENVSFAYDTELILSNVNFTIGSHEKVAIVGMNGSGKSTILNLIQRFYEPLTGQILFDGVDIKAINLNEYRELISTVSQEIYLFDTTIENNIKLYSENHEEQYRQAIEATQFLEKDTSRFEDYVVGSNGNKLSGGQKQKIAIARALIKSRPMVIFDEATSNLDLHSEQAINHLLDTALSNNTVIIVSHRPEILKHVDRVIFLEKGQVSAIGLHEKLSYTNERYRRITQQHQFV
ncbi:hypothetical protein BSK49_09165 [Paenibacillus odorifer]|jgi:ATP-binding cassette subfamily B protein|uniref:ABC transporter ATP-binding protein n=1 Tax=Paenibacillus odorifer TaxID=189426 RepID=A0ABX3GIE0_9BACL|nr:ABC transporter ATP-binding protein [Paenibacillus odorifer]OMD23038.1 hypothetical protein BSO21_22490 [Paenibacillus odorifer]OMD90719.1 hypothetical protein BSK49_09165 [Paenibacillus odorifer]